MLQERVQGIGGVQEAAHAGFPGPNVINGLACDTQLSPLHFEVYEFARRAAPTSVHLLEVRRLLDRVRPLSLCTHLWTSYVILLVSRQHCGCL